MRWKKGRRDAGEADAQGPDQEWTADAEEQVAYEDHVAYEEPERTFEELDASEPTEYEVAPYEAPQYEATEHERYETEYAPQQDEPELQPDAEEPVYGEPSWAEPEQQFWEPRRTSRRAAIVALALGLAISLAGNVLLGVRFRDERDVAADLRRQLTDLQREVDDLRAQMGSPGNSLLDAIAADVASLRGLRFKSTVRPTVLSLASFKKRVNEELDAENDTTENRATTKVLRLLGVIDEDYDLAAETRAIQTEQVGGFYDNRDKELVVPSADARNPSPFDRAVLAHEYTHALIDQYYNLSKLDELREQEKDDESAAFVALAEGDAEAIRSLYQTRVLTDAEREQLAATEIDSRKFNEAPKFLQEVFLFPYIQGSAFVQELIEEGGFERVNLAYEDPPVSTEQILHPEKYLRDRDEPVDVTLPDVGKALGTTWKPLDDGEVGELDLKLITLYGGSGVSTRKSDAAAAGWDGGSYAAFDSSAGTLIAIATAWDSTGESDEANRLFGEWISARFGNVGTAFPVTGGTGWNSPKGAGAVFAKGGRVMILLGPDPQSVQRAAGAF